jgi:3-deoxy-manno-octulosonate cytidylyltransferase (CMP-KDO synthetase)
MPLPRIVIGIPARLGSSRFPHKPLKPILGMPMIEHVYKRCRLSNYANDVFVATCNSEIEQVVHAFGGTSIMTNPDIPRPGLRVYEAAKTLNLDPNDIVVVVQGDEPLVHPDMIDLAIQPLLDDPTIFVSNLAAEIQSEEEWKDPNEIKIVTDLNMNAMYMTRSPIPSIEHEEKRGVRLKQVCIMPFRWHFLETFNNLEPTPLEKAESIEMVRAIQHQYKVRIVPSHFKTKSVDTQSDLKMVESIMASDPIWKQYGEQIK